MKVPVCPVDFLIVKLDKKFQDEIITPSGIKLFIPTEFEPGEHATVTGTVISVPCGMSDTEEFRDIEPDVERGDELIFSYLIVNSMDQHFTYPVHEYEFEYKGESYWKVPYSLVLGYFRDGELNAASGYLYLDQKEPEKHPDRTPGGLWIPDSAREKKKPVVWSVIRHIGKPYKNELLLDAEIGDQVMFEKRFVERYTIKGKKWWVLKQDRVLGKKVLEEAYE